MPAAVGKEMPSAAEIAANQWLTEAELAVYAGEWQRTGFQGGLNWYRSRTSGTFEGELQLFAGRTIDVPSIFIGGMSDWGIYQTPGAFERTQEVCTRMVSCQLLDGAGHWVQQEQAEEAANAWLPGFAEDYNRRFSRAPANPKDLHRPLTQADDLDEILAWREARTVTRNLTLRYDRMMLLLDPTPFARGLAGKKRRQVR
jgi:hypothetical protein